MLSPLTRNFVTRGTMRPRKSTWNVGGGVARISHLPHFSNHLPFLADSFTNEYNLH